MEKVKGTQPGWISPTNEISRTGHSSTSLAAEEEHVENLELVVISVDLGEVKMFSLMR